MGTSFNLRFSPSTLNLMRDCARCFWRKSKLKHARPRGIFPSLPSGMDRVIKNYFDEVRQVETPVELANSEVSGLALFRDQGLLNKWRNWRSGLIYKDMHGVELFGAIDDLLVTPSGFYLPFDYKTKGSPTTEADAKKYYTNQMDCYALMLDANGYEVYGKALLLYYTPQVVGPAGVVHFNTQRVWLDVDIERAKATLRSAVELLNCQEPEHSPSCEYGPYLEGALS